MASFQTRATREHDEYLIKNHKKRQDQLNTVINDLDSSVFSLLRDIRGVTEAEDLSDTQKVITIRSLLDKGKSGEFERLKKALVGTGKDGSWFDVLETQSLRLQNRLSPILRVIRFDRNDGTIRLITAINHFKNPDGSIGAPAPIDFLNADKQASLSRADGTFRTSLYKVFLFQYITAAIKSGHLIFHSPTNIAPWTPI